MTLRDCEVPPGSARRPAQRGGHFIYFDGMDQSVNEHRSTAVGLFLLREEESASNDGTTRRKP